MHALLVEEGHAGDAAARLAAEEEVAGDIDRVAERQVLIDHLDARGARVGRRGEDDRRCRRSRSCRHRGSTAPDSTLLSVDLPAPLSPTSPSTSPGFSVRRHVVERLDGVVALRDARSSGRDRSRRCSSWIHGICKESAARPRAAPRIGHRRSLLEHRAELARHSPWSRSSPGC